MVGKYEDWYAKPGPGEFVEVDSSYCFKEGYAHVIGESPQEDKVNHPSHYTSHPSGIECITITEHMGFNLGNALKYIWRADLKHDCALEDLKKAEFYIKREIAKRSQING